ncbi:MAG: hypothetical protein DDT34_01913 [Firmicutes bacterium]|nr:hypothetical protein [Bacillota bacterium]
MNCEGSPPMKTAAMMATTPASIPMLVIRPDFCILYTSILAFELDEFLEHLVRGGDDA